MRYAIALLIGFGASSLTMTASAAPGNDAAAPTTAPTANASPAYCDPPSRIGSHSGAPRSDAGGQAHPSSVLGVPSLGVPTLTDPAVTGQPYDAANNSTNTTARGGENAQESASGVDDAMQEDRSSAGAQNRAPIIGVPVIQPSLTKPALVQPSLTLPSVLPSAIVAAPAGAPTDIASGDIASDGANGAVAAAGPSADSLRSLQQSLGQSPAQSYSAQTPDLPATALPTPLPTAPPPGSIVQLSKPPQTEARAGTLPLEVLGTDPRFLPYYYGPFDQGTGWGFDFSDPFTYRPGGGMYRRNDVRVNKDLDVRISNDIDRRVNIDIDRRMDIHYDPRKNPK